MESQEYIKQLKHEIARLDAVVKFYESIILNDPELRERLKEAKHQYQIQYNKEKRR